MIEEFISARDRIIAASIDIISDSGLVSLTFPNISFRTNLSEMMIYKCFSNVDEILEEVVSTYFKFDSSIFKTLESKSDSYLKRIDMYVDAYGSYFNSYYTLSSIMLNYEELLHNTKTRELVEKGFVSRREGLERIFQGALDNGEIIDDFTAEMLADMLLGIFVVCSLNRRVLVRKKSYHEEIKILSYFYIQPR